MGYSGKLSYKEWSQQEANQTVLHRGTQDISNAPQMEHTVAMELIPMGELCCQDEVSSSKALPLGLS